MSGSTMDLRTYAKEEAETVEQIALMAPQKAATLPEDASEERLSDCLCGELNCLPTDIIEYR